MLDKYNNWILLELFFRKPIYSYHLREICRLLKWSPIKVRQHADFLKKENLVIEYKERNLSLFKSNKEAEAFKIYKILYNISKAFDVAGLLEEKLEDFDCIVFFGSARRGEDVETSDFDLCIIGSKEIDMDFGKIEKEINRRVSLIFFRDASKLKRENKELLNNLINGFVIKGYFKAL